MSRAKLDGRVAIVSGAGGGIGGAISRVFAAEGGRVLCADIDEPTAMKTAAAIADAGGEATGQACDVSRGSRRRPRSRRRSRAMARCTSWSIVPRSLPGRRCCPNSKRRNGRKRSR